jgi:hypothetical protein
MLAACAMMALAAWHPGRVPDLHALCGGAARRMDGGDDPLQPDLDGVSGHSGMAFRQGAMVSVDVLYRWSPPKIKRVLDWVVCFAAGAGWRDHLVGLGLCQPRQGAIHDRAGERVHVLGLSGHAGGRVFCVLGIIGNLLDPQRLELETAQ